VATQPTKTSGAIQVIIIISVYLPKRGKVCTYQREYFQQDVSRTTAAKKQSFVKGGSQLACSRLFSTTLLSGGRGWMDGVGAVGTVEN